MLLVVECVKCVIEVEYYCVDCVIGCYINMVKEIDKKLS